MTRIASRRSKLRGESNAIVQGRPLVVIVEPHEIIVRPKGKRTAFAIPLIAVYQMGAKLAAAEARRLKAEQKKTRRGR